MLSEQEKALLAAVDVTIEVGSATFTEKLLRTMIARVQRPDVVLAEAERLLREAGTMFVTFHKDGTTSIDKDGRILGADDATLAEAYAALTGGEP